MKILKGIAVIFVLSITAACMGVQADDYLGLIGVDIPAGYEGVYTSKNVKKTQYSHQYLSTVGSTDDRAVRARVNNTNGDHGSYYNLTQGGCNRITGSNGVGTNPGTYNLNVQVVGFHITTTEYTGTWILDEDLMHNSGIC
ncbi:MAG TPA: hypothetical protein IAB27_04205 [Candidatus Coprosoma intestinipullorum]|uniref:Lipoprotein n=1 Tax=Candidatus Coprosoma intestinipullorum TaxID=2840752 RepID=A0A9D0ZRC8_9FIRM|nr:hypothetical protein [Candidatus Coprosoma intestinipullorum]